MRKTLIYLFVAIGSIPLTAYVSDSPAKLPARPVGLPAPKAPQKPNIIFIMIDDLGWNELNCYGNTFNETPNLDKLAAQGLRFTQAYSAAAICSPSRAALMTGQFPARIGITDFLDHKSTRYLDPAKYVTMNEALASAGYHTGMIGKWHLDTDFKENKGGPKAHGFDEVIATETKYIADGDYFAPYFFINTIQAEVENEFLPDRLNKEAVRYIRRNKEKPFYLYLAHYAVHSALDAPAALVEKYKKKYDARHGAGQAYDRFEKDNRRHVVKVTGAPAFEISYTDNPYLAAQLERIDAGIGEIMAELDKQGIADNTLLVFFSDNGGAPENGSNNGQLRAYKSWLYEGGLREPLLVRWPGTIKPGTVDTPVCAYDFYPTFLELAGAKTPANYRVDGVSIAPLLLKGKAPKRDTFFWHYPSETGKWKEKMASAVRKGAFKYLEFYQDGRQELYNLKTDPSEKQNLVGQLPEKAAEMKKLLHNWRKEVKAEQPVL